ncbi:MAG: threonine/serine exporter family protein, partial [Actinobacteria bacterium]
LRNGAETYRVEDTIKRICFKEGFQEAEVFVFPTGIIVNGIYHEQRLTRMKQITERDINLTVISRVNSLSRRFAAGQLAVADGLAETRRLAVSGGGFNKTAVLGAGALASAAATILLGGSWVDFWPALAATALVRLAIGVTVLNLAYILRVYLAGAFAGLIGATFVQAGFGLHVDKIIIGAVLPLVPGVALTNAIRDFISGDLLSGTTRLAEALLVAAAIAGGVGVGLGFYLQYLKEVL